MHNRCYFTDVESLAKFVAAITREGLAYQVEEAGAGAWTVTITGF